MITWNRAVKNDIEASLRTGVEGIAISIPTSDQQIIHKIRKTRGWVLESMAEAICFAKKEADYIVLGMEDASRADLQFLKEIFTEAEKLGVKRIRFADTLGVLEPITLYNKLQELPALVNIPVEFHAHNDLGMATANAIAAVQAGFKALSVTVSGLGERTGNTPLEEVAAALQYALHQEIKFDLTKINEICSLVNDLSKRTMALNKPIIGQDVFTHTSSIHIDGIYKDIENYQLFPPESVGRKHAVTFGKYSGRKILTHLLNKKGILLHEEEFEQLLVKVQHQCGKRKRSLSEDEVLRLIC